MNRYKKEFDVFVCGGSQHVSLLKPLLKTLLPFGTVHLGSSFFSDTELDELRGLYDVLHEPRHSNDGYSNFELFSIRDINRLASAPHFIKLDADTYLDPDWIKYVEESLQAHPDAVLFGPNRGNVDINVELSGAAVRQLLNRDVVVADACKVIGGFYVGLTSFFKMHKTFMDLVHEFLWCYEDGRRYRPVLFTEYWPSGSQLSNEPIKVLGQSPNFRGNEDTLRSLVVHATGAGDRLHVLDSNGRIKILRPNTVGRLNQERCHISG
jgi:hypothetical protein